MIKSWFQKSVLLVLILIPLALNAKTGESSNKPREEHIFLSSELLAFADGKSIGINAEYIGFILQILRELSKMQEGEKEISGSMRGLFLLNGNWQSIRSLRKIEAELELEWCQLQQHQSDNSATMQRAISECKSKQAAMKHCLYEACEYFVAKILPFNAHARGIRSLTMELIKESCTARSRTDSYLLNWGACEEGKEAETIHRDVTSFQAFDVFLTDLIHFLKDLVYSCPKAREAFKAMVKQKMGQDQHEQPNADSKK
ncbi:MAG TPA: hypothetical protein VFF04_05705 [Candidatus Babeliales bacterium]|nr:hypothetical protein [Candidatus Babeliales bacterium]